MPPKSPVSKAKQKLHALRSQPRQLSRRKEAITARVVLTDRVNDAKAVKHLQRLPLQNDTANVDGAMIDGLVALPY
jgi:hypothetical protein